VTGREEVFKAGFQGQVWLMNRLLEQVTSLLQVHEFRNQSELQVSQLLLLAHYPTLECFQTNPYYQVAFNTQAMRAASQPLSSNHIDHLLS
jgi:hypothetical protein